MSDCLSELELDRLLAGDPAPALRARLSACRHCQDRLAALTAEQQAWMTPDHVARQTDAIVAGLTSGRQPRRWLRWTTVPVALAAAAALVVLWPRPDRDIDEAGEIRIKGGQGFDVVLASPGAPRTLDDGEAVPVGATLSFRAACPGGCSVALFAVSASGIDVLADATPPPWPIGEPALLPVSAVVDAGPGDDTIVALLCEAPTSPTSIEALHGLLDAIGPAALQTGALPSVPGCAVRRHRIHRGP